MFATSRPYGVGLLVGLERLLISLWLGALCAIGYLAVPILFASLDDRVLAGMLAGKMFSAVSLVGLGCGSALLALLWTRCAKPLRERRFYLLLIMLVLVVLGEFVLQPQMAELKAQGLAEGGRFAMLHGIASLLYMANSLIAVVVLVVTGRAPQAGIREA